MTWAIGLFTASQCWQSSREGWRPLSFGFSRLGSGLAGHFAEFPGLFLQNLHLSADQFPMQGHQRLWILGLYQLLRVLECVRHVLLGKAHDLVADFLGARLGNHGLPLEGVHGRLRGLHELVEGELGLLETALRERAHLSRNFERGGTWHCRLSFALRLEIFS